MRNIFNGYKIFELDPTRLRSKDFFKNMLEYRGVVMKKYKSVVKKRADFKCILCGTKTGQEFLKYEFYPLFECLKCKAVSPNLDFKKISGHDLYDDPACVRDTIREVLDTYEYRKKIYAPERLGYILEKTGLSQKNIKLLDVGCGPGYFISHLKDKKIKYKGLELADFLVKICKDRGLNVESADLKNEPDGAYNIVTLFDVLEHLDEPKSFFKTLQKKLIAGGYVLAYTPNIHSLAYYLMGGRQNTLVPFQHLCFYDSDSLSYLAKASGFEVCSIDYYGLDLMDYLYMKEYEEPLGYHQKLKDLVPVLQAIVDKQKLSNHMRIILKKN